MSCEWTHQFCLACDKQTDGATYCSESCRLAEFEKTASLPSSGASSGASSPTLSSPRQLEWSFAKPASGNSSPRSYPLSPAYDFGNPNRVDDRLVPTSQTAYDFGYYRPSRTLSPSASHASLNSIQSLSAGSAPVQVSESAARELQAYAYSFESVRLQRRRSTPGPTN